MTKLKENVEHVLLEEDTATIDSIDAKLEELQQELIKMAGISEYDEQLVRKMIEKITIYDDKFVIEFKSGTSLDVRR